MQEHYAIEVHSGIIRRRGGCMKAYVYLIAILLITLGLAIAVLNDRLNTLEESIQVEFENLTQERNSQ